MKKDNNKGSLITLETDSIKEKGIEKSLTIEIE